MLKHIAARFARWCLGCAVIGGGLFSISGLWTDPWMWAYVSIWMGMALHALLRLDDDLAKERFSPPTRGADRVALASIQLIAIAHLVIGALDVGRWHIAPVEPWLRVVSMVGMVMMGSLFFHSMLSNKFFSSVVRIQEDRGHRVVDTGPYALVRHPGYAGMIPLMAFSGLALGSWLSFAFGVIYGALIFRRVLFEDAFLQANLTGYRDYSQRVPHRLVPGLW